MFATVTAGGKHSDHTSLNLFWARHQVVRCIRFMAPLILNCGARSRCAVSFKLRPLYSRWKCSHPPFPIMRLGGSQNVSERYSSVDSAENWTTIPWSSRDVPQHVDCTMLVHSTKLRAVRKSLMAYLCGCELRGHALRCVFLLSWFSLQAPHGSLTFNHEENSPVQRGNNKLDLRENRIVQWHFAWKEMTRQSNGTHCVCCLRRRINTRWAAEHSLIDTPF